MKKIIGVLATLISVNTMAEYKCKNTYSTMEYKMEMDRMEMAFSSVSSQYRKHLNIKKRTYKSVRALESLIEIEEAEKK